MSPSNDTPGLDYSPHAGRRDEMVDADGNLRSGWVQVHAGLAALGPDGLARTANRIRRRVAAHGTTFQRHGHDESGWALDAVPLVVPGLDWSGLGLALTQRALVLEAILADLHGGQRLLRRDGLPAAALVAHEGLLLPCLDTPPPGGRHLVTYAADVVRRPDGRFTVLADHLDDPAGVGLVLEDRAALADAYPELVRTVGVRRITPWFEALRRALVRSAPSGVDDPRIVVLHEGATGDAAVEEALLARTLGYTLVRGADLTVRRGSLFLKAVGGLEPVHVVLRRLRSADSDPLELRAGSTVGVPGLVEAVRRANVSVVNPLGAGVLENPALLAVVSELTPTVLGEDPLISTVPTWWCGDPSGRSHVLANLDRLVVKPIHRGPGRRSLFGRRLSSEALADLRARINARPHLWVGQEELDLPSAPWLADGRLRPGQVVQRAFAVADEDGFAFLEGALSRTAAEGEVVSPVQGGTGKDTWVIDSAELRPRRWRPAARLPQVDLRASVTSQAAEAMFWVGRNLERSDLAARLALAVDRLLDDWPDLRDEGDGAWRRTAAVALTELAGPGAEPFDADATGEDPGGFEALRTAAVADRSRPRSLATSLHFLLDGSHQVRELFSVEAWRTLGAVADEADALAMASPPEVIECAQRVLLPLSALSGLLTESMVRDPGWRFLDTGRRIERSLLLASTLRSVLGTAPPEVVAAPIHELVLVCWDSLVAYRRRYRSDVEPATLLDLLVVDDTNPRALASQLELLTADLAALPDVDGRARKAEDRIARLRRTVVDADTAALVAVDGTDRRPALLGLIGDVVDELLAVARSLDLGYFAHVRTTTVGGRPLQRSAPSPDTSGATG